MNTFLQIALARLKSKTPTFFKTLRTAALWIGAACIAVITIQHTMSLFLPPNVEKYLGYAAMLCAGIAGTATFTSTVPPENTINK